MSSGTDDLKVCFVDTPILKILKDCQPALRFLYEKGPSEKLPGKYAQSIKRLESLGIVYKRNNSFCLKQIRLEKVLARESQKLTRPFKLQDLLSA